MTALNPSGYSQKNIISSRDSLIIKLLSISLFISTLYGITVSIELLRKETKIVFLDKEASYMISSNKDKAFEVEKERFLIIFFELLLNYTSENHLDKNRQATNFLSPGLWNKLQFNVEKERENVKKLNISQVAGVRKITKETENKFKVFIEGQKKEKLETTDLNKIYTINLIETERTDENPYGLYINEINEENKK